MKLPVKAAASAALSGLLATASLFGVARHVLLGSFEAKLAADTSTRLGLIREKLNEAARIADSLSGFVETTPALDQHSFVSFSAHLLRGDAALTALSFVAAVPEGGRERFEGAARALTGKADYALFEGLPGVAPRPLARRSVYYPVLFTNTRDASALVVLGYDVGSSPVRLAALERARDSGRPVTTERITLVGTAGKAGFVVFTPVYAAGRTLATPEERRAALTGFAQAIFSLEDLVAAALAGTAPVGLPFELRDALAGPENRSIFRWTARLAPARTWRSPLLPEGVHERERFSFAGRPWEIDVAPNAAYLARNYPLAHWAILPLGLVLTGTLAAYLHGVLSRRERLAALNAALESEIARRGRVEEALRASEEQYRIVADNTAEWEFWLDPAGRFVYCSPSSVRMTGYASARFLEDPALLNRIIVPEDRETFRRHRHEVTASPSLARLVFRIRDSDGAVRWVDHICQPVHDAQGRFLGTRGSNRDITERKRIEEERERLIADLQKARHEISTLEGILPICASCKKIRGEDNAWVQVETYVSRHSAAEFSHGICPDCMRRLYPSVAGQAGGGES